MADPYTTLGGETVDIIANKRLGRTADVTESILVLNPGLAAYGAVLPAGLTIAMPDPPAKTTVRDVPRIWS